MNRNITKQRLIAVLSAVVTITICFYVVVVAILKINGKDVADMTELGIAFITLALAYAPRRAAHNKSK